MDFTQIIWNQAAYQEFKNFLLINQDLEYRKFHSGLVPGLENFIGIRMPILRKTAKLISAGDWKAFLFICEDEYYEEVMIQGLIIGIVKTDYETFKDLFFTFLDKINNWAVCDSFCSGLKKASSFPDDFFSCLGSLLNSHNPWHIRTGLVTMLFHFINDTYIDEILQRCDKVSSQYYYVKMANAWLISICYIKYPEKTLDYLTNKPNLDQWTFRKSIQKIRESTRVSPETKVFLKSLPYPGGSR